jgi:hypothetical protein
MWDLRLKKHDIQGRGIKKYVAVIEGPFGPTV